MRAKEVKISVQKFVKIIWATLSLIGLIISLWIIVDCFKKVPDTEKIIVNYFSNTNLDYKVYLKKNKFYEKTYMEKDKKYIADIIDYIDINLNYNYNTSVISDTVYSYNVTAIINSQYEQNNVKAELWSKTYPLIPFTSLKKDNTTGFQINQNIRLDYPMYDKLAKKFKEEYAVAADTSLTVLITIKSNTSIKDYNHPLSQTQTITLEMPLNKTVTDITLKGNDPINENITELVKSEQKVNTVLLGVAIVVALACAPVAIISFYKLFGITNDSQYILEQKKILKSYADIIAEVTSKPDLQDIKIIEVKQFEDLINIEEELRIPILFYEFPSQNESWFVITTDTQAYRYVLKSQTENDDDSEDNNISDSNDDNNNNNNVDNISNVNNFNINKGNSLFNTNFKHNNKKKKKKKFHSNSINMSTINEEKKNRIISDVFNLDNREEVKQENIRSKKVNLPVVDEEKKNDIINDVFKLDNKREIKQENIHPKKVNPPVVDEKKKNDIISDVFNLDDRKEVKKESIYPKKVNLPVADEEKKNDIINDVFNLDDDEIDII